MKGDKEFKAELRKAERSGLVPVRSLDVWQKGREDGLRRRLREAEKRDRIVAGAKDFAARFENVMRELAEE